MKNNWQTKKLDDACNIDYGTRVVRSRIISGDFDVYGGGGKTFTLNEYNRENCTVVSRFAMSKNCVRTIKGKFFLNDSGLSVSTKDNNILSQDFLEKFLFAFEDKIYNLGRGQAQRNLYVDAFKKIEIPLPPLKTQKEIVTKLDEKMAKIKEARKLREESLADTEKILSQTLHDIFEEGKQNGWEEKAIEDIAPIRRENNKKFLPYVGMEDVESGTGIFLGSLEPKKVRSNTFYFDNTCVLYGRLRPYLNKVLTPDFEGHCSTEMFPLVPNKNLVIKEYLFYWITQNSFITDAMRTAGGARMPRANMKEVMKFKILLPSIKEQQKIVKRLDDSSAKIRQAVELQKSQLEDLKKLEKAYLKEAFNGELV